MEALPYITIYGILFAIPLYTVYTAFFRKAPALELAPLIQNKTFLKYYKK